MKLKLITFIIGGLVFVLSVRNSYTQDTKGFEISSIQFSNDTKNLLIAEYSGRIIRWNLIRDSIDKIFISDNNNLDLLVLDDGLHFLTAGLGDILEGDYGNKSMSVFIDKWNINTGEKKTITKFTDNELFLPKLSPNGKYLVYAFNNTSIKVINLDDNTHFTINLRNNVENKPPKNMRERKDFSYDTDHKDYQSNRQNNDDFWEIANICFSNNGKYCEIINLFGDLFIINLDKRDIEMLIKDFSPYQMRMPAISDKLGVVTLTSGSIYDQNYYLYFINIKNNQFVDSVNINSLKYEMSAFEFSKNDDYLLFGTEFDKFGKYDFNKKLIYLEKERNEGQSYKMHKDPISEIIKLVLSGDEYLLAGVTLFNDIVICDVNKLEHIKKSYFNIISKNRNINE